MNTKIQQCRLTTTLFDSRGNLQGWYQCVRAHAHPSGCVPGFGAQDQARLVDIGKEIRSLETILGSLYRDQAELKRCRESAKEFDLK